MCLILNGYRDKAVLIYIHQRMVDGNTQTEITHN